MPGVLLDEFFPFDLGHGVTANTARWRKMAQLWQVDGVISNYLNQLNAPPTVSGTTVTVNTGGIFLHGYYGEVQNPAVITVGTNGSIVAGVDLNAQSISIYYRDGVTGYGTGGYQQDTNVWEMPLYLISGTAVIDIRTRTSPSSAVSGCNSYNGSWSLGSGLTQSLNLLPIWLPYSGLAEIRGELQVSFSDASAVQSAICSLTYQYGQTGAVISNGMTPAIPGGGPSGQIDTRIVAASMSLQVTQGKKNVGWLVTAGTGPVIALPMANVSLRMISMPAVY